MKVSEIQVSDIVSYMHLEEGEYDPKLINDLILISKSFIKSYTGLSQEQVDTHEDFVIVVYVLCQDMHDNRTLYVDNKNLNKVVDSILGMHCVNLL